MNMIASCKRGNDLLAEYITYTECSYHGKVEPRGVMAISLKTKVLHPNLPTKPKEAT